jgi:aminoglycoside phosphotransferase (APT) family kinase protein
VTDERPVRADFSERSVEPVLAALEARAPGYSLVRKLPDGVWGAWLVADGHGEHAVLKCVWDVDWRDRLESAARVVDALAARGAPVPRYVASGYDEALGTWYLQEHLAGDRVRRLTPALLADVLELNALQAGVGEETEAAFDWSARVERRLYAEPWRAATVHPPATVRGVLDELDALVRAHRGAMLPSSDAVHGDFLATQLLADDGRLAGVLDWDAAGRGHRGHDLGSLFCNVFAQADRLREDPDEAVVRHLGEHGFAVCGAAVFGLFLAYHALEALRFVLERNPKHLAWRASIARRVLAAYERVVATG